MAYKKTTWETGNIITAEKLNNIENGIAALTSSAVETIVPKMQLEWDDAEGSYFAEFSPASSHVPVVTEVYAVTIDGIESLWVVASVVNVTGEDETEYTESTFLKLGVTHNDTDPNDTVTYRYSANSSNSSAQIEYHINFDGGVLPPPVSFSMNLVSVTDWHSNGIAPSKIRSTSGTLVQDRSTLYYMNIAYDELRAPVPGELCLIRIGDAMYVGECNWELNSVTMQGETMTIFMPWIWTPLGTVQYLPGENKNARVCVQQDSTGPSLAGENITIDIFNLPDDYICALSAGSRKLYTHSPAKFINVAMSHFFNESFVNFDYTQPVSITRQEFPMLDERGGDDGGGTI